MAEPWCQESIEPKQPKQHYCRGAGRGHHTPAYPVGTRVLRSVLDVAVIRVVVLVYVCSVRDVKAGREGFYSLKLVVGCQQRRDPKVPTEHVVSLISASLICPWALESKGKSGVLSLRVVFSKRKWRTLGHGGVRYGRVHSRRTRRQRLGGANQVWRRGGRVRHHPPQLHIAPPTHQVRTHGPAVRVICSIEAPLTTPPASDGRPPPTVFRRAQERVDLHHLVPPRRRGWADARLRGGARAASRGAAAHQLELLVERHFLAQRTARVLRVAPQSHQLIAKAAPLGTRPVSYTHLTLPTILLV